jgi:hypothetical protein
MSSSDLSATARATVNNLKTLLIASRDNATARQLRAADCIDFEEAYQRILECALAVEYYDQSAQEWIEYSEIVDRGLEIKLARIWLTIGGPDIWIVGPYMTAGEWVMYGCWYSEERIVSRSWVCKAVASYIL